MPFCTQCGTQVRPIDLFCGACGTRQPAAQSQPVEPLGNVTPRTASLLCYIPFVGWLASVIVLASTRFREDRIVRFHAFQGLYLFVIWLILEVVVEPTFKAIPRPNPMRVVSHLMSLAVLGAWIWMIIKTAQEQFYRLPLVGELAERSVAEQQ